MLADRLKIALADGVLTLPEAGRIAVVGASRDADLSALPKDRTEVVTRHFPAHEAFRRQGFAVAVAPEGPYALAILCLPRAKAEARHMVATLAETTDGPLVVDGQKTDGVDTMLKALKARAEVSAPVVKAHGKLFQVNSLACPDWIAAPGRIEDPTHGAFVTTPGVFSSEKIDPGSRALADALPDTLKGRAVDLGAGWGFLSRAILARAGVTTLDLVEADHTALDAARQNIDDPRARLHWADALTFTGEPADHVITNPPFHQSRRADPALGQGFIQTAARLLKPKGRLWLVANRHLPYERTLGDTFKDVRTMGETNQFKLFSAAQPKNPRKG